jgi:hypothetical protein
VIALFLSQIPGDWRWEYTLSPKSEERKSDEKKCEFCNGDDVGSHGLPERLRVNPHTTRYGKYACA